MTTLSIEKDYQIEISKLHYLNSIGLINISDSQISNNNIPQSKIKKIKFINDRFFVEKLFFTKKTVQLCSTAIGRKYGVKAQTVLNWITQLTAKRLIEVSNPNWCKGHRSKIYRLFSESFKNKINDFNGYNEKYKSNLEKQSLKKAKRKSAWQKLDPISYQFSDLVRIAQTYLGCPEQYLTDCNDRISSTVLKVSSESNVLRSRQQELINAYNHVAKNNTNSKRQYSKITTKNLKVVKTLNKKINYKNSDDLIGQYKNIDHLLDMLRLKRDTATTGKSEKRFSDLYKQYFRLRKSIKIAMKKLNKIEDFKTFFYKMEVEYETFMLHSTGIRQ